MTRQPYIPFSRSGSYPVRAGNLVHPLIDGEPAFRRICEAVEAARHSVWVAVTFLWPGFEMPDRRGSFFKLLDDAVRRGLDVRVIFWRVGPETEWAPPNTFSGSRAQRDMLRARGSRFRARWDRAHSGFCQHQKSWLVDAGHPTETAFVGGINLNPNSVVSPGHDGEGHNHDVYVEVAGPAATDVHHNFVQRWNEASERRAADGTWGHDGEDDLRFPGRLTGAKGSSLVQIQRTVHAGRYSDRRSSPGARSHDIAGGERSILEQYLNAIGAARRSIYIENQAIVVEAIVVALLEAVKRDVEVVLLVPADPDNTVTWARRQPDYERLFETLASLGDYERFTLAGIAGRGRDGRRNEIHVHAKIMLIDDAWATIGSCNLHASSLFGNGEMNASFWDPAGVRRLRCELLTEHLAQDTGYLDDRAAFLLYRQVVRENRRKRDDGAADWQGLAYRLDPATYGE